ncbi:MAG: SRPBCC domain-containing protein [Flavobacteriaceae bacterium]|nr:SRPBCC domain-containing protein [Flavobacteriaceae bacterium]
MEQLENIPQDIDPVQISARIHAPINRIWNALTQPALMRQWYFDIDREQLQDGDTFQFYEPGDENKFLHECLILEMNEPEKFRHTWTYPLLSKGSSTVNWDLEAHDDETEVIITHEGIHHLYDGGDGIAKENFINGWKEILNVSLRNFVESTDVK